MALCKLCHWTFDEGMMGVSVLIIKQKDSLTDAYEKLQALQKLPLDKRSSSHFNAFRIQTRKVIPDDLGGKGQTHRSLFGAGHEQVLVDQIA